LEQRILCKLDLGRSGRIVVDFDRLPPPCKTESRAVESKLTGLEISTEVAAKLDVLEAVAKLDVLEAVNKQ
jgi:hypothetical protein